jgi:hypothetical protein
VQLNVLAITVVLANEVALVASLHHACSSVLEEPIFLMLDQGPLCNLSSAVTCLEQPLGPMGDG